MTVLSQPPDPDPATPDSVPLPVLPADLPPVERRAVIPPGFVSGATTCGIKASGRPDLAVVRTTAGPAAAAAIFTANAFAAPPVRLSRTHLAATAAAPPPSPELGARFGIAPDEPVGTGDTGGGCGLADAIVVTSGSANAATGQAGHDDQVAIAVALATAVGTAPERTLHMSTGIIGTRLPVERVRDGIARLTASPEGDAGGGLSAAEEDLHATAVAMRTTDSVTKVATTTVALPDPDGLAVRSVRVTGIAKGVGMIHPQMATMLSILLTDAAVPPAVLRALLRTAAARTWNQLSVDGDTSTNDTVFLLASGAAGTAPVAAGSRTAAILGSAVEAVARDLARQQAADGEGASTVITCQVSGALDDSDARAVARAVVSSSLVKAAVHGRDPNWGRIAGAAGNATLGSAAVLEAGGLSPEAARTRSGVAATVDPDRLRIGVADELVYDGPAGGPVAFDRAAARTRMDAPEVVIRLDLGLGRATGEAFGCDLTEEYVRENSEYTT